MATLPFRSLNQSAAQTILLLHGGNSSGIEWDGVASHLTDYHLLIPDLHHSPSFATDPDAWTFANLADMLQSLITKEAHNSQVDLVGLSMGGYLSVYLAANYPHLVRNTFISGSHTSFAYHRVLGGVLGLEAWVQTVAPKWLFTFVANTLGGQNNGAELHDEVHQNPRTDPPFQRGRAMGQALGTEVPQEVWEKVKSRTLLVAGSKEIQLSRVKLCLGWLQKGNEQSQGVIVQGKVHPWNQQDPELFAQGIRSWIEGKALPTGYVLQ